MPTDTQTDQVARKVNDELEIEEFIEPSDTTHQDQDVDDTQGLPEDTPEATSGALIRVVPVAYGALLGSLADRLVLGLSVGMALGVVFDLFMGNDSIVRPLLRSMFRRACPAVAALAHGLAGAVSRLGLAAPAVLSQMRCDPSQS